MWKFLPYPFQYIWFRIFLVFFTISLYFARESLRVIFILQGWYHGGLSWDIPVILDTISLLFAATVAFISRAIFSFGRVYIRGEIESSERFWRLVIIFVLSIFIVIFVPNILIIILGWDGLGISSFLLVIHYQNTSSLYGGYITVLSNRIGDVILLLVVGILGRQGHRYSIFIYSEPVRLTLVSQIRSSDYFTLSLLAIAAYRKRAQLPFNAWLPEAMAAPTPVRALVHSSTLVTAGVYLLIRTYEFWSTRSLAAIRVAITGGVTMLIGGGKATIEGDVKKTIAYSTISQLGYIVVILGLGHPRIAFFHLITHALFKSTIFISAGVVFSYGHHYQTYDQWHSKWQLPLAGAGLAVSLAAINVFPFLAGMYSKELIVATAASQILLGTQVWLYYTSIVALILAASQTIIYTVRIWRGLFMTKYTARAYYFIEKPAYRPEIYTIDNVVSLRLPFLALIIGTATAGRIGMWILLTPADLAPFPGILKVLVIVAMISGVFRAFLPCRGVTKIRVNQRVYNVRSKRKQLRSRRGLRKVYSGFSSSTCGNFITSGTEGDFSHAHDGAHFFIDRAFAPIYRIYYLSAKITYLVEQGMLQLWSLSAPRYSRREVSLISQNIVKHVNSYLGVSILLLFSVLLFMIFYSSLIKASHLYCDVGNPGNPVTISDLNSRNNEPSFWVSWYTIT